MKTQMKCSIMLHFIRVYTVCYGKKDLQTKKQYFSKIITWHPEIFTMDNPKFIVSNQKEKSISIQWYQGITGENLLQSLKIVFDLCKQCRSWWNAAFWGITSWVNFRFTLPRPLVGIYPWGWKPCHQRRVCSGTSTGIHCLRSFPYSKGYRR